MGSIGIVVQIKQILHFAFAFTTSETIERVNSTMIDICNCSALHLGDLAELSDPPPTFSTSPPTFPHSPPPCPNFHTTTRPVWDTDTVPAYIKPTSCLDVALYQESADIGDPAPGLSAGPELRQAEALSGIDPLNRHWPLGPADRGLRRSDDPKGGG